ncbi:MAG: hypothetical protein L0G99_09130, partial [Propionibacteriales bacterium]|nr:hypothetical protein [Propionibacteriales bacterium]
VAEVERSEIFDIAHRRHPIAAPVAPERVRDLIGWLSPSDGGRVRWIETDATNWSDGLLSCCALVRDTLEVSADAYPDLGGLVRAARDHEFEPAYGHVSTLSEWDDYQFSWTGALVDWAVREASTSEDRDQALAVAREHRDAWLSGARGELGFATFVMNDTASCTTSTSDVSRPDRVISYRAPADPVRE